MSQESPILTSHFIYSDSQLEEERKKGYPSLDNQRKVFAHYYVQDFNHRNAAEKANFSANRGIQLLREPLTASYVTWLKNEVFARLQIDAEMVRTLWLQTIPKLSGEEAANRLMRDGSVVSAKNFDGPALVAALRELGKMTDVYQTSDDRASVNVQINLGSLGVTESSAAGITIEGSFKSDGDDEAPV